MTSATFRRTILTATFAWPANPSLSKVPIPEKNIHRVHAELDAEAAAAEYDQQLRDFFHLINHEWPRFDLIFLGIGEDGHTASLFPESKALAEASRRVAANWVEKFKTFRITLTLPVLNHAAEVVFLVSGSSKAQILSQVLRPRTRKNLPSVFSRKTAGCCGWWTRTQAVSCGLPRLRFLNLIPSPNLICIFFAI